jgi:hypothetical protein
MCALSINPFRGFSYQGILFFHNALIVRQYWLFKMPFSLFELGSLRLLCWEKILNEFHSWYHIVFDSTRPPHVFLYLCLNSQLSFCDFSILAFGETVMLTEEVSPLRHQARPWVSVLLQAYLCYNLSRSADSLLRDCYPGYHFYLRN